MTSKASASHELDVEELEDGEIEDDLEEFNEYESLFQTSERPEVLNKLTTRSKSKTKRNNKREERGLGSSDRTRSSHTSRSSYRRDRSKSPSLSKSHLSSRRRISPVNKQQKQPLKRSHSSSSRRRSSGNDVVEIARGIRQKAETRLRHRNRDDSLPKPTMRYLISNNTVLHQTHPSHAQQQSLNTPQHSSRKKTRTSSEMEQYEQLLQKHREIQEAIQQAKSDVITASHNLLTSSAESLEVRGYKQKSRSRSRSGSQSDVLGTLEQHTGRNEAKADIAEDDDEELDELQLRMIALRSATRAVAAREEKENQKELKSSSDVVATTEEKENQQEQMEETNKDNASSSMSPVTTLSKQARQEERKQKLLKWKKQHSLTVEINKATDEKGRYELFMDHMIRGPDVPQRKRSRDATRKKKKQHIELSLIDDDDNDSDVQEIPLSPTTEGADTDNYEAVEMDLDTEDSVITPPIPGVSEEPEVEILPVVKKPPPCITIPPSPPQASVDTSTAESHTDTQPQEATVNKDDEDDEMALRQLLLQSMKMKRAAKAQQQKTQADMKTVTSEPPAVLQEKVLAHIPNTKTHGSRHSTPEIANRSHHSIPEIASTSTPDITSTLKQLRQAVTTKLKPVPKPKIPVHKPVIIQPGDDSDSSDEERGRSSSGLTGIDLFLKQARISADKAKSTVSTGSYEAPSVEPTTPEAMSKLPDVHRAEYQRLKQEIYRREQQRQSSSRPSSGTASPDPNVVGLPKSLQVTVKSAGSKSATSSPDRSVIVDVLKRQVDKVPKISPEEALLREQRKQELLLKERIQQKEVKNCQEKMLKHRQAIEKGHKLLKSLDVQVVRKNSIVNMMQGRVKKLKGELVVAEKMVILHTDQATKFEEQKQQVRKRLEKHVIEEKQLRTKLASVKGVPVCEINQTGEASQRNRNATKAKIGSKRPLEPSNAGSMVNKKSKNEGITSSPTKAKSDSKLLELQKLERAYAHQIEHLRTVQAKKAKIKMSHISPAASRLLKLRTSTPNIKPARQLFLKDKIALGSGSSSSGDEGPASKYVRRKSWLDGQNTTLKPNLLESADQPAKSPAKSKHPSSPIPSRKLGAIKRTANGGKRMSPSKDTRKQDKGSKSPPEPILDGLYMPNTQQMKLLQQIQAEKSQRGIDFLALAQCFEALNFAIDDDDSDGLRLDSVKEKRNDKDKKDESCPLTTYTSPLIHFKAYRLCPHFEAGSHITRHSNTASNKVHPMKPLCKYELNGTCNDEECPWQHERDYLLKELELYSDLSSYMQLKNPNNASSSSDSKNSNADKIEKEFEKMIKLIEKEKEPGKINVQRRQKDMVRICVDRVRKYYKNKGISVLLQQRKRPKTYLKSISRGERPETQLVPRLPRRKPVTIPPCLHVDNSERYFFGTSGGVLDLEAAVLEKPNDIQLWLMLGYKQLSDDSNEKSLDKALYALCRGLESNKGSNELWFHYLNLYEQRDKHPDLLQLCQQAVKFAPDYRVWWKYLTIKRSFSEKDTECEKLIEFVKEQQKDDKTELGSHRLLETLLYRIQLHITTRRINLGLSIFQDALREYSITSLSRHLLPEDRCLAWLAYLHVMCFHCLPPSLFDPATGAMGQLVSKEPFMFPWDQADSSRLTESLITGFQDALLSCSSSQLPIEDSIKICLPIYHNLFTMEAKLNRLSMAQSVCRHLLHDCPSSSQLWLCLVDIEKQNKSSTEDITKVFQEALTSCPTSAELHYWAAKYEFEHNTDNAVLTLRQFVMRYYTIESNEMDMKSESIINLYRSLLNQHLPYDYKPPALAEGITPQTIQHNMLYLWSCFCLYLDKLQGHDAVTEAYETALCALKSSQDVQKLWIQYLEYQKSTLSSSSSSSSSSGDENIPKEVSWKVFTDLVNRCLISMATIWPLPHSSTETWKDYSFHNRVLELYCKCVRKEDIGDTFELYINRMPHNISLAFRACQHAIDVGNGFQAQLITRAVLSDHPTCIPLWKIAIALCVKSGQTKEAHQMYQRAVEACPFSASLWKDYLLFEVTRGKSRDELKTLILRCRDDIGLNINDYLATIFKT